VNPRAGSALQHVRRVREEETVEVVGNHAGGTRSEMASRSRWPRSSYSFRTAEPGVDSRIWNGGGAIFGNPKRGDPVGRPDRLNGWSRESRRQGQEGPVPKCVSISLPPRRRSSQVIHRKVDKAMEGSGEANEPQRRRGPLLVDAAGQLPVVGRETGTCAQARAELPGRSLTMVGASSLQKRGAERSRRWVKPRWSIEYPEAQRTPCPSGRAARCTRSLFRIKPL